MSTQISTESSSLNNSGSHSNNSTATINNFGIKGLSNDTTASSSAPSGTTPVKSSHAGPKKKWLGQAAVTETKVHQNSLNGISQNPIFNRKRRNRVEDFKRMIEEIPKLPDMSDFEALRPFTDNNLISEDVRKLTHGKTNKGPSVENSDRA